MKSIRILLFLSVALGFNAHLAASTPAWAISADLAKKCRQMAFKAYPPKRVGTKVGNAQESRKYYRACLANGGAPPEDAPEKPATPPTR